MNGKHSSEEPVRETFKNVDFKTVFAYEDSDAGNFSLTHIITGAIM